MIFDQITIQTDIKIIMHENPEMSPSNSAIDSRTMFRYDNHTNIPWNITQYKTPTNHFDQKQIIRNRLYSTQKKGVKVNDYHFTKKDFYMDYMLKVGKSIPSSVEHQKQEPWDGTHHDLDKSQLELMRQSKKFTYFERMEMRQSRDPVPGVSKYNLQKSLDQKQKDFDKESEKKRSIGEKRFFHEDTEYLGDQSPGAGFYNPHDEVPKLYKSRTDWVLQTKKSQKINKTFLAREKKKPDPGTYIPVHQDYNSFSRTERLTPKEKSVKNGFGSDSRFPYVRPNKKKINQKRPSPATYQTKIYWKDKSVSPKKKQWVKMIWKGSSPGVYH